MHQNNCFSSYSSQDLVIRNDLTLKNNVVLDIKMSLKIVTYAKYKFEVFFSECSHLEIYKMQSPGCSC